MRRREGGREGEGIPRVWEGTVAAEGMFGNLNPLGDGPGRSLADHGARVPEVLRRERRLLLSWAKAGKDSKGRNKATRSEGDDLGDSAARALMRHGGRGRGGRG